MGIFVLNDESLSQNYSGSTYVFRGVNGPTHWPKEDGTYLGPMGTWNALWRLGFHPQWVNAANLPSPSRTDVLFVSASGKLEQSVIDAIRAWNHNGGTVLASGFPDAWHSFFPAGCVVQSDRFDNPYAGLAYLWADRSPELIAPPKWTYLQIKAATGTDIKIMGRLVAVHGDRQTPHRALITQLDHAPAVVQCSRFFYLNGNPFAAFQSWLQGQEDLEPWLSWRHRLFWLDEWAAFFGKLLAECRVLPVDLPRAGIPGLRNTIIVLRHDLDSSRDTAYLEEELKAGLPGVHTVLKDRNTNFWVDHLRHYPDHEVAFHYNTVKYLRIRELLCRMFKLSPNAYRVSHKEIIGKGLLRQVKWAKKRGVGIETLHRHGPFIIYPEWIDALNEVFDRESGVLGSSTLFRGLVLRWGVDRVDGIRGTLVRFPDVQFPFWFPFKLAHAGKGGLMLRGWETTAIMEIEPQLFEQMLDYKIPGLPQRVITLIYHPAHANRPTFAKGGSLPWFRRIMEIIEERDLEVRTLRNVYYEASKVAGFVLS